VFLAVVTTSAGCGGAPPGDPALEGTSNAALNDNSGLKLPPDFKPVALPVEKRKEIFREAHRARALAVQEANEKLPMDDSHLPSGNKVAFDKRVADHKEIQDEIRQKKLAALAQRHDITLDDLSKIEDEASRLRWLPPPEDPKPDKKEEK
jgi:hypothetical protein